MNFKDWLDLPEVQQYIDNVAKVSAKKIWFDNKLIAFISREQNMNVSAPDLVDYLKIELYVYLLSHEDDLKIKIAEQCQKSTKGWEDWLASRLILRMKHNFIDKRRTIIPESKLYKRITDVLRPSKDIFTRAYTHNITVFSTSTDNQRPTPIASNILDKIDFPDNIQRGRSFKAINKKKFLIPVAVYFYDCVKALRKENCNRWIFVRDFRDWIIEHIDIHEKKQEKDLICNDNIVNQLLNKENSYFLKENIEVLANNLTKKEKRVLKLRYGGEGKQLPFDKIAQKMGYANHTGPLYTLNTAKAKIKSFFSEVPDISYKEQDGKLFDVFIQKLISLF